MERKVFELEADELAECEMTVMPYLGGESKIPSAKKICLIVEGEEMSLCIVSHEATTFGCFLFGLVSERWSAL